MPKMTGILSSAPVGPALLSGLLLLNLCSVGATATAADGQTLPRSEVIYNEVIDGGMLVMDGRYLPGPYRIEATRESLQINERPWEFDPSQADDSVRPQSIPVALRRMREHRSGGGGRGALTVRTARRLANLLQQDQVVVLNYNDEPRALPVSDQGYEFYRIMFNKTPSAEQKKQFTEWMSTQSGRDTWDAWLHIFVPDEGVRRIFGYRMNELSGRVRSSQDQSAALMELDQSSYALSVTAMLLAAIACCHMLRWPRSGSLEAEAARQRTTRATLGAIALVVAMSAVDLVWTILAYKAGVMKEVNPVAARFIDSPMQLAMFKAICTGTGILILFALRNRRTGQLASWWMCAVCVLLTVRWVVFDSL